MGLGAWTAPRPMEQGSARGGGRGWFTTGGWARGVTGTPGPSPLSPLDLVMEWDDVLAAADDIGWIDRERASGLPGVGRGVELVCDVIGSLTLNAVHYDDDPHEPIVLLPRSQLLRDPDPLWHGRAVWLGALVRDCMYDGNGFGDKTAETDRLGYPTRLPLVPPDQVTWEPPPSQPDAAPLYVIRAADGSRVRELVPSELMHVAVGVDSGKRMGRGILHRYQDTLRLLAVVERATYVLMRDGKPAGLISTDVDMTADELGGVKRGFIDGVRRDGIGALVRAQFGKISWSAEDLALVPAREFNLRLASDITGVTPYLLGVPSESRVYANIESEWSNFIRVTVQRYTAPLQDSLTKCVPRGQSVRFNLDELARPDAAVRWVNHKTAVEIGAMTIGEVRQAERMGPMPEEAE